MVEITHNGESHILDGFNGMEVNGCVDLGDGSCEVAFEEGIVDFWTVYGHWRTGGVRALWDLSNERDAAALADRCEEALKKAGILEYEWRTGKEIMK